MRAAVASWRPQSTTRSSARGPAYIDAIPLITPVSFASANPDLVAMMDIANDLAHLTWTYDENEVRIGKCWPHDVAMKNLEYDNGKHAYYYMNKFGNRTILKPEQVAQARSGTLPGLISSTVDDDDFADYLEHMPQKYRSFFPREFESE